MRDGAVPNADRDDKPNLPEVPPPRSPVTLDRLFERLAGAKTPEEAKGIANLIQRRWARSGSDTADLLMTRAQDALKARELPLAIELLDRVVTLEPDWAEGWNQRANALFLAGDPIRSLLDIAETLKREPRHYGAMMGLGTILRQQGDDKRAMVAYRRALAIYPQLDAVKDAVESLKLEVDGRDA
ncbi:Tetratricopeptide repeat-containing protein [Bosea lupini]|uniref:Tetratricopeptide repeat-containing protein n=1 Tax=Bosea lupini TaxID=1036779 RepID=A0A1H7SU07_9HYPH|nr:Tetratricopeptide repeat-containing protein [Bosea lupini]